MNGLSIENLSMRFELPNGSAVQALKDVSLQLNAGELLSVLGPSGCGKTTLLNILAGFLAPTSGQITMNGHRVTGPGAERGMVFQQGALFEWMSVRENVGFGPSMKHMPKGEKTQIVDHLLEVVGLRDFKDKSVYELSGGMQQRVALARCLANDPDVILMDEPLGALDKALRETMQLEIRRLHREFGTTLIYVTHDQEEALVMSDRICVMNHAKVEQLGTPSQIYSDPETIFAATFIGHSNLLHGTLAGTDAEGNALIRTAAGTFAGRMGARDADAAEHALIVRPERVTLGAATGPGMNELRATLRDVVYIGSDNRLMLVLPDGTEFTLRLDPGSEIGAGIGEEVTVHWPITAGRVVS